MPQTKSTEEKKRKGLTLVYTGAGKGKTTSAMGVAFRAAGYGMKTAMIQFIKGSMYCGELESAKMLAPYFEISPMGKGFVAIGNKKITVEEHKKAAHEALALANEKMLSGEYNVIICDEINNAVKLNLIDVEEAADLINNKPEQLHLLLTGRDAHEKIIAMADLVTEMKEIKHPFKNGIIAQQGIDY